MKETDIKGDSTTPTKVASKPATKFDGFIEIVEPTIEGTYAKRMEKFYLSDEEAEKFMGDVDLNIYWRGGKVPVIYKGEYGNILKDDAPEKINCDKIFAKFPGILLFRHPFQALYTLLIPKKYSDLEKDANGEYANRIIFCDARSIVFGAAEGGMYTEKNFKNKAKKILEHLVKTNSDTYIAE
jgi:hypothetical protein